MNENLQNAIDTARAWAAGHPAELALAGLAALVLVAGVLFLFRRRGEVRVPAAPPARDAKTALDVKAAPASSAGTRMPAPPVREAQTQPAPETAPGPAVAPPEPAPAPPGGLFGRLRQGLARTQSAFVGRLDAVLTGRGGIDEEAFEEIEEILYTADLGVATATRLLAELREASERGGGGEALRESLKQSVEAILAADAETTAGSGEEKPRVVLFVGVNGVGKTTTIGKIGAGLVAEGRTVILAAADTFRAAAIEQLEIWGKRIGATVIKQETSSDPSAVVFDAVAAAKSRKADVVLVDTAGRLHTKANLMEELKKMTRILGREIPGAPHEVILVLDATTGQNALTQARQFNEAVGVTGIALTKLDGTARGGIVIAVHEELKLPIRYIGVGERVDDLRPFDAHDFVEALFARD